jgi:hypothetical protein
MVSSDLEPLGKQCGDAISLRESLDRRQPGRLTHARSKGESWRPSGSGTAATQSQWTAAFVQRMRELGWIEGRNLTVEYRWAEGRTERFAEIADEFVRLKVDVILTHNTQPALAAKQATSVIPIVMATAGDPVGTIEFGRMA